MSTLFVGRILCSNVQAFFYFIVNVVYVLFSFERKAVLSNAGNAVVTWLCALAKSDDVVGDGFLALVGGRGCVENCLIIPID
jgi:hypothetical protein